MRDPSTEADRLAERTARQHLIRELRRSRPPGVFKIMLYGLGAGAGAAVFNGLLYLLLFGVLGALLHRLSTEPVLVGFQGPLLVTFASSLLWNGVMMACLSAPYHFLCRPFPRLAGPRGAIALLAVETFAISLAARTLLGAAPIELSIAVRAFIALSTVTSILIAGGVIGQAELFERRLSPPVAQLARSGAHPPLS